MYAATRSHEPKTQQPAAILAAVRTIAGDALRAGGFAVAAPVAARFTLAESGTTGVELMVRLADPASVKGATAALARRFGDVRPPDAISVS